MRYTCTYNKISKVGGFTMWSGIECDINQGGFQNYFGNFIIDLTALSF